MKLDLKKILKQIKPNTSQEKAVKKASSEFLKKISKSIKKEKANVVFGGSIAKGTWLADNHDIDVFVQFENSIEISKKLEEILKKSFNNVQTVHGSRDYFHIEFLDFTFEIVPVVKIKTVYEAKNVTDASVFHIKWVLKHTNKKLRDETRLVKQFCKAAGVYGAETYIAGFSGYVVEVLTVYFGSFEKFVKGIPKLAKGVIIDPTKHKRNLDRNKISPIILIDPVQGDRNAAAALSLDKLNKLKKVCQDYLKKPSLKFFEIKRKNIELIKKNFDIVLEIEPLEGKNDIVGTKVLKVFEHICDKLDSNGFIFLEGDWEFGEPSYLWFNIKNNELEKDYVHYGPPITALEFAESFREKYKGMNIFISQGRLAVTLKKEFFKIGDYINHILKSEYITERVKSIKKIK